MRTRLSLVLFLAGIASTAMGSPSVNVSFVVSISASCAYDITDYPATITLTLAPRSTSPKFTTPLKFKEKKIDATGAMVFTFLGQGSFPSGEYDTQWPDAKFAARIWRLKDNVRGYYPSSPECVRRERDKNLPLESSMVGTFPKSAFLGFPTGTTTKTFATRLSIPNTLEAPPDVCSDLGCH